MKFNLVEVARRSISDPLFYDEVRKGGGGRPIALLALFAAVGVVFTALVLAIALQDLRELDLREEVADRYPDGLVIEIQDGVASTSVSSPYFIDDPELTPTATSSPRHLAVIDTRPDVPYSEILAYDAVAVLTDRTLFFFNPNPERGDDRNFDLSSIDETVITKASVMELASMVEPWIHAAVYLLPVLGWVLLTLLTLLLYLFFALLGGFVVKLIARLKGFSIPYGSAYVAALYALIPVLLFDILTDLAGFGFLNSFWLGALIFTLIVGNNVRKPPTQTV